MPHELWAKVFSNLELQDVKAVRLAWRVWTDIGSRAVHNTADTASYLESLIFM
jgi:hypothetical protein